jgi:hypothetical protein
MRTPLTTALPCPTAAPNAAAAGTLAMARPDEISSGMLYPTDLLLRPRRMRKQFSLDKTNTFRFKVFIM